MKQFEVYLTDGVTRIRFDSECQTPTELLNGVQRIGWMQSNFQGVPLAVPFHAIAFVREVPDGS